MNSKEYIEKIVEELAVMERQGGAALRSAFLGAALAIVREIESPLKEQALVTLATLELHAARRGEQCMKKIA